MLSRSARSYISRYRNIPYSRSQSTNTRQRSPAHSEDAADFRPPWVYTMSRLMTFTIIPSIVLYSVFFYDFGDRDHVFQPVRKWALAQKAAFFTLSPEEEKALKVSKTTPGA